MDGKNLRPSRLNWLRVLKPKPIIFSFTLADEVNPQKSTQCLNDRAPRAREQCPKSGPDTRNGYLTKTLLCDDVEIGLSTPRDFKNTFEPQLIKKNQTRITQMDSQILSPYAKGITTREIVLLSKKCPTPMCHLY